MNSPTTKPRKVTFVHKIESMHAHQMLLYLFIIGAGTLFGVLLTAFTVTRLHVDGFRYEQFPYSFVLSTAIIIVSSFVLAQAPKAFQDDNMTTLKNLLGITFLLGLGFCLFQFIGWMELQKSGIFMTGKASGAYLYLISGLHALHLIGGMIYLGLEYQMAHQMEKDPVKQLVLSTSPYEKLKLKMLCIYWHFLDALWLLLFLYFLISF